MVIVHLNGGSKRSDKEGGEGGGHSDPEIRGRAVSKIFFTAFRGSVWSKNKRGGGGGRGGRVPALDLPLHLTLFIERTFVRH